jgi:Family of unknown function (DUF6267)
MFNFKEYLTESEEGKLKHIHHAEDRPLMHGHEGFEHAYGALKQAHEQIKSGKHDTNLTMKYDGSPSIVFGHHPESGKFFVASKSAFNKNPKINYTEADVDKNHGHAPGLAEKLKSALRHLPKVAPKSGVYQGDVMHSGGKEGDVKYDEKKKTAEFTPNTITYTAHGDEAHKAGESKFGVVVHQKYEHPEGEHGDLTSMHATPHPDSKNFKDHKDVHLKFAEIDASKVKMQPKDEESFNEHLEAARKIHKEHGNQMYTAIHPDHSSDRGHLSTYINSTVRTGSAPTVKGFQEHLKNHFDKEAAKVKTDKSKQAKNLEAAMNISHVERNKEHYDNLLKLHQHLQKAKNSLVHTLNQYTGGLDHHIDGKHTDPEGFVVNHTRGGKTEPTKLVNREEFSRANLLKVRK